MKDSIRTKLETTRDRFEEIAGLLADPDVINDQNQFRDLSKEYSRLEAVVSLFQQYETLAADIVAAEEMVGDSDSEIRQMGARQQQRVPRNSRRHWRRRSSNFCWRPFSHVFEICRIHALAN